MTHPQNPDDQFYIGIYALFSGAALLFASVWFS